MYFQTWSTPAVAGCVLLAAVSGFVAGQHFAPRPSRIGAIDPASTPASRLQPLSVTSSSSGPTATGGALSAMDSWSDEELCRAIENLPVSPDRNADLLEAFESMAMRDPQHALAFARAEKNQRLKTQLLSAVFRGWGRTQPDVAATWILAQPEGTIDVDGAINALFQGAAGTPDRAVELVSRLSASNPSGERSYGDALIYAFGQRGDFRRATDFARASVGENRTEWLAAAYGNWANYDPLAASAVAQQIADPVARTQALDAVMCSWGVSDPAGLANFAVKSLVPGEQQTRALNNALVQWAATDVSAAADWIKAHGLAPEFDQGEAAIATHQSVMRQPEIALRWAESVSDLSLRSRTISAIIDTWALTNRAAALSFLRTTGSLLPTDRNDLIARYTQRSNQP